MYAYNIEWQVSEEVGMDGGPNIFLLSFFNFGFLISLPLSVTGQDHGNFGRSSKVSTMIRRSEYHFYHIFGGPETLPYSAGFCFSYAKASFAYMHVDL